jgi:hypothetical protein
LGDPVEFLRTAGPEADVTQAEAWIAGPEAEAFLTDQASDSDAVVKAVERPGAAAVIPPKEDRKVPRDAVIPPKEDRKVPRDSDAHLSKGRKKVERFISGIKPSRRVATRSEETAGNFRDCSSVTGRFWHGPRNPAWDRALRRIGDQLGVVERVPRRSSLSLPSDPQIGPVTLLQPRISWRLFPWHRWWCYCVSPAPHLTWILSPQLKK